MHLAARPVTYVATHLLVSMQIAEATVDCLQEMSDATSTVILESLKDEAFAEHRVGHQHEVSLPPS